MNNFIVAQGEIKRLFIRKQDLLLKLNTKSFFHNQIREEYKAIAQYYNIVVEVIKDIQNQEANTTLSIKFLLIQDETITQEIQRIEALIRLLPDNAYMQYLQYNLNTAQKILNKDLSMYDIKIQVKGKSDVTTKGKELINLFYKKKQLSKQAKYAKYKDNLEEEFQVIANFNNATAEYIQHLEEQLHAKILEANQLKLCIQLSSQRQRLGESILGENKELQTAHVIDYAKRIVSEMKQRKQA